MAEGRMMQHGKWDDMPSYLNRLHVEVVVHCVECFMQRNDVTVGQTDEVRELIEQECVAVLQHIDKHKVHCGQCERFLENATPHDDECPHFCTKHGIDLADGSGYCSWAERKSS